LIPMGILLSVTNAMYTEDFNSGHLFLSKISLFSTEKIRSNAYERVIADRTLVRAILESNFYPWS
jgi:hypothetical protein